MSVGMLDGRMQCDQAALQAITGNVAEINMASLMKDLEANFGAGTGPSSSATAKNPITPAQRQTVQRVYGTNTSIQTFAF